MPSPRAPPQWSSWRPRCGERSARLANAAKPARGATARGDHGADRRKHGLETDVGRARRREVPIAALAFDTKRESPAQDRQSDATNPREGPSASLSDVAKRRFVASARAVTGSRTGETRISSGANAWCGSEIAFASGAKATYARIVRGSSLSEAAWTRKAPPTWPKCPPARVRAPAWARPRPEMHRRPRSARAGGSTGERARRALSLLRRRGGRR